MAEFGLPPELANAALKLKYARLPENDRDVAGGWLMLGLAYGGAGLLKEAIAAQAEGVRLYKAHGHGAADTATAHHNHAAALSALGRARGDRVLLEQAKTADETALELWRTVFGDKSEQVAASRANLAISYAELGNLAAALTESTQALEIERSLLPSDEPRIGVTIKNTGAFQMELGHARAARSLLEEALTLFRNAYGRDDHANVLDSASWLVACHLVLARRDPAQDAEARRIAAEFGLDWDEVQRTAAQFPGPVD